MQIQSLKNVSSFLISVNNNKKISKKKALQQWLGWKSINFIQERLPLFSREKITNSKFKAGQKIDEYAVLMRYPENYGSSTFVFSVEKYIEQWGITLNQKVNTFKLVRVWDHREE